MTATFIVFLSKIDHFNPIQPSEIPSHDGTVKIDACKNKIQPYSGPEN
jgi:hypothetical protein